MPKLPIKPTSSAPSSERARAFRERLDQMDLARWEIVASEDTRMKVREIASAEGLTAGVAAEALLQLGIEAYHALQRPAAPEASAPWADAAAPGAVRPAIRPELPPEPTAPAEAAPTSVVLSARSLAAYTSRSQPGMVRSGVPPTPEGAKASAPLQGFFDRARQRKNNKPQP